MISAGTLGRTVTVSEVSVTSVTVDAVVVVVVVVIVVITVEVLWSVASVAFQTRLAVEPNEATTGHYLHQPPDSS